MARARRRKFKGCCMMCASAKGKLKGYGTAQKLPFSALRKLGKKRRLDR